MLCFFLDGILRRPGSTRLEHFPEKVIVVTLCEIEEPHILEVLRRAPTPSYHSVAAAQGSQQAAMVEDFEGAEGPIYSNPDEQSIVVQNFIVQKGDCVDQQEPHRIAQEQRKGSNGASQRYDQQVKAIQGGATPKDIAAQRIIDVEPE